MENTMKFDCCIMNPPYGDLHLKVLEQVLKVADKVINISPVRWLQDPFAPYLKGSAYNKFEKSVSKHIKNIQFIKAKDATELFDDASFTMNLGIYELDANGGWNYQHNDLLVNKIIKKTMQSTWVPYSQKSFYKNGCVQQKPYVLNIGGVMGGPVCCTTYQGQLKTTLSKETSIFNGGGGAAQSSHFEFDTEEERHNFYDCYSSDFMKWTYTLWKPDNQNRLDKIPYFSDYTHKWKLRDFFSWFNLTPAECTRVVKEIRDMRHAKIRNNS